MRGKKHNFAPSDPHVEAKITPAKGAGPSCPDRFPFKHQLFRIVHDPIPSPELSWPAKVGTTAGLEGWEFVASTEPPPGSGVKAKLSRTLLHFSFHFSYSLSRVLAQVSGFKFSWGHTQEYVPWLLLLLLHYHSVLLMPCFYSATVQQTFIYSIIWGTHWSWKHFLWISTPCKSSCF